MREIKFRAWDVENKEMISGDNLAFEEYAPLCDLLKDTDKMKFMQYTGLRDKTGKEAYDFDICVMDERQSKWIIYPVKCGSCICTIDEWNQSNGHPILTNALSEMQNEQCFEESSTIIGNIFENPELVESVKE